MRSGGLVKRLIDGQANDQQVIETLYVRSLCRKPTPEETQALTALVAASPDRPQALEDIFWALLNSREFLFNH